MLVTPSDGADCWYVLVTPRRVNDPDRILRFCTEKTGKLANSAWPTD